MGTSRSVAELGGKLRKIPAEMAKANEASANRIGMLAKGQFLDTARADNHGKLEFRNVGKRGAKLGIRYQVDGPAERKTVDIRPSTGRIAWRILESGARPHVITSKRAGGSRRSRAQRVRSGQKLQRNVPISIGGLPRAWAKHPGVRARGTFTKASDVIVKTIATREYRSELQARLNRIFR